MLHSIKEQVSMVNPNNVIIILFQRLDYKRIGPHNLNFLLIFTEKDKFNYALAFPVMNVTTTEVPLFSSFIGINNRSLKNGQIWTMDGRLQISNSWRTNLFRRLSMLKWQEQVDVTQEIPTPTAPFQYHHLEKHIPKFLD